ncbi:MAG: FG-GAP repeat protein [Clostridia bacterium]|jgi:hypothetical protein
MSYDYSFSFLDLVDSEDKPESFFGHSVCINGFWSFISSTTDIGGAVFVFHKSSDGEWEYTQKIVGDSSSASFGYSLSSFGNYLVIGDIDDGSSGKVFLYKNNNNVWELVLSTSSSYSQSDERYGDSVFINEENIIVGFSNYSSLKGAVEILNIENDSISSVSVLKRYKDGSPIFMGENGDLFGKSVCIYDDYAVVGAPGENSSAGSVYIYYKDEDGEWKLLQNILASDGNIGDSFGYSVALDSEYLIIGAINKDGYYDESYGGVVYVYKKINSIWVELKKIYSSIKTILDSPKYFGYSLSLNNGIMAIGSPGGNFVDIVLKENNWRLFKNLSMDGGGDFGSSVSINNRNVIIGDKQNNSSYLYEKKINNIRLGQEFTIDSQFIPSKVSLFLKRYGENNGDCWIIGEDVVIDATNFSSIDQGTDKITLDDSFDNFSGNGYMIYSKNLDLLDNINYGSINYPLKADYEGKYNVWIRRLGDTSGSDEQYYNYSILLDGIEVSHIEGTQSGSYWEWDKIEIVFPDKNIHTLSIQIKGKNCSFDKIYITRTSIIPENEGPDYSVSPFLTVHFQIYDNILDDYGISEPGNPIYIYDYKTSLEDVSIDDWYNFDSKILDSRQGYSSKEDFDGNYFIVLSSSGESYKNQILWEIINLNNDSNLNSVIKL